MWGRLSSRGWALLSIAIISYIFVQILEKAGREFAFASSPSPFSASAALPLVVLSGIVVLSILFYKLIYERLTEKAGSYYRKKAQVHYMNGN